MKRPRIKICGITNIDDASQAVELGADALGFVFYRPSSRYIDILNAKKVAEQLPPFVSLVGLFVDAEPEIVYQAIDQIPLTVLQFHGAEDAAYCDQFKFPYIKALRMSPELALNTAVSSYPNAKAILLDAYKKGVPGGTGEVFDWGRVPKHSQTPIILAGGLTPDNISRAVAKTQPYAVDVSGGVESMPGIKDHQKIADFISRV